MAQKLILPLDNSQINAGYKIPRYLAIWGFNHYGVDLVDAARKTRALHACGTGTVAACGMDGDTPALRLGNCVVIVYPDVLLPDGRVVSLSCRMFHLDKIACKAGDKVTAGTVLGDYGSTGQYSTGPHLHIEFDTDVEYPAYAYGLKQGGNVIKQGSVDSTLDPCKVFWLGAGQSLTTPGQWITEGWVTAEMLKLPSAGAGAAPGEAPDAARLQRENAAMKALLAKIHEMSA